MATKKTPAKKAPAKKTVAVKSAAPKVLTRGAVSTPDDDDGRGGTPIFREGPSK